LWQATGSNGKTQKYEARYPPKRVGGVAEPPAAPQGKPIPVEFRKQAYSHEFVGWKKPDILAERVTIDLTERSQSVPVAAASQHCTTTMDESGSSERSSDYDDVIVLTDTDDEESGLGMIHNAAAAATAAAVSVSTPARKRKAAAMYFPLPDRARQQLESLDPLLQTQFLTEFPNGVVDLQSQEVTNQMTAWLKKNAGAS
jgi:hypothetical protein